MIGNSLARQRLCLQGAPAPVCVHRTWVSPGALAGCLGMSGAAVALSRTGRTVPMWHHSPPAGTGAETGFTLLNGGVGVLLG